MDDLMKDKESHHLVHIILNYLGDSAFNRLKVSGRQNYYFLKDFMSVEHYTLFAKAFKVSVSDLRKMVKNIRIEEIMEIHQFVSLKIHIKLMDDPKNNLSHYVAMMGHLDITKNILKVFPGMEVLENSLGFTPLHYAAKNGHFEVYQKMANNTTQKNPISKVNGSTPLGLAGDGFKKLIIESIHGMFIEWRNTTKSISNI